MRDRIRYLHIARSSGKMLMTDLAFVFVCNAILRYTIGRKSDDLLVASMEIGSPYPHTFRGFVNLVKQDGKRYCIRPDIYFESFMTWMFTPLPPFQ